jgi:hypothetical protein
MIATAIRNGRSQVRRGIFGVTPGFILGERADFYLILAVRPACPARRKVASSGKAIRPLATRGETTMRTGIIGLATALTLGIIATSQASTGPLNSAELARSAPTVPTLGTAANSSDSIVIARRGRGADDPPGDDHGRHHGGKGKGKGGKGRGGHDDGPNHDRNDDHGVHGPNHT